MRLTKAPTYADYVATFARRKKGSDVKPIFRDCQIRFKNDIFTVVRTPQWYEDQSRKPKVMWTIDPFNIVTLYAEPRDITGEVGSFINPRKDVKILVKKDAVKTVSASTARLRKLTITMARMGVFDKETATRLDGSYYSVMPKPISDINYQDPLGEDAEAVFYRGMLSAIVPSRSGFVDGQWKQIPLEERRQAYHRNIIESGMKALRKHIYEETNSYERVEV